MESPVIKLQVTNDSLTMSDEWYPLIVAAVNSWNSAGIGISIQLTTESSPFTIVVTDRLPTENGKVSGTGGLTGDMTFAGINSQIITSARITIYASTFSDKTDKSKQAVIAHEIGHLFGLKDNPTMDANLSIMNYDCYHELYYVPQEYDLKNVMFIMCLD